MLYPIFIKKFHKTSRSLRSFDAIISFEFLRSYYITSAPSLSNSLVSRCHAILISKMLPRYRIASSESGNSRNRKKKKKNRECDSNRIVWRRLQLFLMDTRDFLEGTYSRIPQSMQLFAREPMQRSQVYGEHNYPNTACECIAIVVLYNEARVVHRAFS